MTLLKEISLRALDYFGLIVPVWTEFFNRGKPKRQSTIANKVVMEPFGAIRKQNRAT